MHGLAVEICVSACVSERTYQRKCSGLRGSSQSILQEKYPIAFLINKLTKIASKMKPASFKKITESEILGTGT